MAKEKPEYQENTEFNSMAVSIAEKYPEKFHGIEVDKICCVNIVNKDNPKRKEDDIVADVGDRCWKTIAVKAPMSLHCPYEYYVILYSTDWDELGEKHKLALCAEVLHSFDGEEKTVRPCDIKGYHSIFNTLGLDFLSNPDIPHLLKENVIWKV